MENNFKDYAHLYLGCDLTDPTHTIKAKLHNVNSETGAYWESEVTVGRLEGSTLKPLLRPLSDMTKEEIECISRMSISKEAYNMTVCDFAKVTKWHLEKGFDLFNLIESGIAIDKTNL